MPAYSPKDIEPKWQRYWAEHATFKAAGPDEPGFDPKKPKIYILDMFPYPSGDGLHVGHPVGYNATDIMARYKRHKGFNVLHPMGWDSFGLPAEQYAVKTGQHPSVTTKKNIDRFRSQLQRLGFSYDWDREIATSDSSYYRWTQWIFRKLFEKGLAYQAEVPVWWCEALGTVLANEEVDSEGRSEVGNHPCVRRNMRQWMLRITDYAERLLDDLKGLDWPAHIIKMQVDWIGRSDGADLDFKIASGQAKGETLRVFTTRPDTLFGATYMVLAPEHPLVMRLCSEAQKAAVLAYVDASSHKSERDRMADTKEKSGAFTGAYALNPVNGEEIPIWIADYVLASYGTGAIMAVPVHDERDFAFAKAMGLAMRTVVRSKDDKEAKGETWEFEGQHFNLFDEAGLAVNSGFLDGMPTPAAKERMILYLEEKGIGKRVVRYKLRDWLFSRQRYWGEPFPVIFDMAGQAQLVPEADLPVSLPEMESFVGDGGFEPPLARLKSWVQTPQGRRECNTMPQWAGSCWYFLRFLDPKNEAQPWDKKKADYWMPVDLYIGGAEHAVGHLLYSRFWYKVFFDLGLVSQNEPYKKLFNQGMIIGTAYKTRTGVVVKTESVQWVNGEPRHPESGEVLQAVQAKMSKSLGNVINPDHVVDEYGADALRLYEMFMGPLEQGKVWDTGGIQGVFRFLRRVYLLLMGDEGPNLHTGAADLELERALHVCIEQVSRDIEGLRYNTAISAMMIFLNEAAEKRLTQSQAERLCMLLSPFAPHLAEELWSKLGHKESLAWEAWPVSDAQFLKSDTVELVVQVNGKLRSRLRLPSGTSAGEAERLALADSKISELLQGRAPKKVIVVRDKIVNVVL